jgi:hypothetical protein
VTVLMRNILGWFVLAVMGAVLAVNGLFMLTSPKAWLRLPKWVRAAPKSMTEAKYGSGWGAIQTRIAGGVWLGVIIWFLYDYFLRVQYPGFLQSGMLWAGRFLVAVVLVIMSVNAIVMLVSPRAWSKLPNWIRAHGFWFEAKCASGEGTIEARVAGAILLALLVLLLYPAFLRGF